MIHSSAVVHESAQVADSAIIGPFCVVRENAVIGEGTELLNHVTIGKNAIIGKNNKIFQYASIGEEPIDYTYRGEFSQVIIGDNNVIRECATIHGGTSKEDQITRLGNNNLIMCYAHIGHDCKIGNNVCLVNNAGLAGHVRVDDFAILSANVGIHQFCRIGAHSFIAHAALVGRDVPPYVMVTGRGANASPCGINSEGLKRRGYTTDQIRKIKEVYRLLYRQGLTLQESFPRIKDIAEEFDCIKPFVDLIESSTRGILK